MRYLSLLGLFVSMILMGCPSITPVEVPLPVHKSKLVLNGILNDNQVARVYVSYSKGVRETNSDSSNYVEGVKVVVFEEDELKGQLKAKKFTYWEPYQNDSFLLTRIYYEGDFTPQPGKKYRVEAKHPDYDPIWAETVLPEAPEIQNESIELNQIVDQSAAFFSSYSFSVDSETPAYIRLQGDLRSKDTIPFLEGRDFPLHFNTPLNDPKYDNRSSIYWLNEVGETAQVFFSAAALNNPPPEIERFYFTYTFSDSIYYAYRIAFEKHNESAFNQPNFAFPIERTEIPSNVHGGYGILGSFIEVRDSL